MSGSSIKVFDMYMQACALLWTASITSSLSACRSLDAWQRATPFWRTAAKTISRSWRIESRNWLKNLPLACITLSANSLSLLLLGGISTCALSSAEATAKRIKDEFSWRHFGALLSNSGHVCTATATTSTSC